MEWIEDMKYRRIHKHNVAKEAAEVVALQVLFVRKIKNPLHFDYNALFEDGAQISHVINLLHLSRVVYTEQTMHF